MEKTSYNPLTTVHIHTGNNNSLKPFLVYFMLIPDKLSRPHGDLPDPSSAADGHRILFVVVRRVVGVAIVIRIRFATVFEIRILSVPDRSLALISRGYAL